MARRRSALGSAGLRERQEHRPGAGNTRGRTKQRRDFSDARLFGARHASRQVPADDEKKPLVIELLGEPKGKGRPRFARRTGHAYTPQETASYEACLRHEAALAMAGRAPLEGPLLVQVAAHFEIPASWSAKKRAAALAGEIRPTKRPDWENVAKMLDALNEVVWRDDAQVVSGLIEKHYSDRPRLRVEVAVLAAQQEQHQ
jgi:Holliday junction resolvase RusA-like endonuclease